MNGLRRIIIFDCGTLVQGQTHNPVVSWGETKQVKERACGVDVLFSTVLSLSWADCGNPNIFLRSPLNLYVCIFYPMEISQRHIIIIGKPVMVVVGYGNIVLVAKPAAILSAIISLPITYRHTADKIAKRVSVRPSTDVA